MRRFCLFLTALLVLLALPACDQKPKTKAPAKKKVAGESPDAALQKGREQIVAGQFTEAAETLKKIQDEQPDIRQPLLNWISMQEGMALLFAGKGDEARAVFAKVEQRGLFSRHPKDELMANFFVNVSHQMRSKEPVKEEVAKDYDRWTFEGIALLLYALKNWNLEKFEEAVPLFQEFDRVAPEKMVDWAEGPAQLQQLKELATACVNDYREYLPAHNALSAATTTEQQHAAVQLAKEARARMKLNTKLSQSLDASLTELGPKVAAVMAEKAKMSAEEEEFDAKNLPAAKQKRADLMGKFQFEQARQAILDPQFKLEQSRDEQQLLAKRSSWLANFKAQLVEDINATPYAQPLKTKAGAPIAGGASKADETQVLTPTVRGTESVPWSEIAPESIFTMGKAFITPDMTPEITSFRKWHLGVYASYIGKQEEAVALMKDAAAVRPILQEELPFFTKPLPPADF